MKEEQTITEEFFKLNYQMLAKTYLENIFLNNNLIKMGNFYLLPNYKLNTAALSLKNEDEFHPKPMKMFQHKNPKKNQ